MFVEDRNRTNPGKNGQGTMFGQWKESVNKVGLGTLVVVDVPLICLLCIAVFSGWHLYALIELLILSAISPLSYLGAWYELEKTEKSRVHYIQAAEMREEQYLRNDKITN